MSWLAKIFVVFIANLIGLLAASYFIPGFNLVWGWKEILGAALILVFLNLIIRPILKLVLSPIIFFTLGLGVLIVNALIIYLLDFFSFNLTIEGLMSLIYASLIIGFINFIFHLANRS